MVLNMAKGENNRRTLNLLRFLNWFYWGVEQFNVFSGKKNDLYGIIDYLVITEYSTIGIQSCGIDFAPHVKKITDDEFENAIKWLSCENRYLFLIGWRKVLKRRGLKQRIYKPRIGIFYLDEKQHLHFEEKETTFFDGKL